MSAPTTTLSGTAGRLLIPAGLAAAGGFFVATAAPPALVEAWYLVFVLLAGLSTGALGLLMIGHLMSEDWLAPVRREAESLGLALPLLIVVAVPLAFRLDVLFPWARAEMLDLPAGRAYFLQPFFFFVRAALYLAVWTGLAFWITRARNPLWTSGIGLALLGPTVTFAANDWVLSREPYWWSSLFGFAFAVSQLLGALALALILPLSRSRPPEQWRMVSLERALLTLALLTLWTWFAQFLIVWLANLPEEAAWYIARVGAWKWAIILVAFPALVIAIVILLPPGIGRWTMLSGAALALVHHLGHMLWLIRPGAREPVLTWNDLAVVMALGVLYAIWVWFAYRTRPSYGARAERGSSQASVRPTAG